AAAVQRTDDVRLELGSCVDRLPIAAIDDDAREYPVEQAGLRQELQVVTAVRGLQQPPTRGSEVEQIRIVGTNRNRHQRRVREAGELLSRVVRSVETAPLRELGTRRALRSELHRGPRAPNRGTLEVGHG